MADVNVAELIRGLDKTKQKIDVGEEYDPRFEADPAMAKAMAAMSSKFRNAVQYEPSLSAAQNALIRRQNGSDAAKAAAALIDQYQKGDVDLQGKSMLSKADVAGKQIMADASVKGQKIAAGAHEYAAKTAADSALEQMQAITSAGQNRTAQRVGAAELLYGIGAAMGQQFGAAGATTQEPLATPPVTTVRRPQQRGNLGPTYNGGSQDYLTGKTGY